MAIQPEQVYDRGHGVHITAHRHNQMWDVESDSGAVILKHNNHYDTLLFGNRQEQIEMMAYAVLAYIEHEEGLWNEVVHRVNDLRYEQLMNDLIQTTQEKYHDQ